MEELREVNWKSVREADKAYEIAFVSTMVFDHLYHESYFEGGG